MTTSLEGVGQLRSSLISLIFGSNCGKLKFPGEGVCIFAIGEGPQLRHLVLQINIAVCQSERWPGPRRPSSYPSPHRSPRILSPVMTRSTTPSHLDPGIVHADTLTLHANEIFRCEHAGPISRDQSGSPCLRFWRQRERQRSVGRAHLETRRGKTSSGHCNSPKLLLFLSSFHSSLL